MAERFTFGQQGPAGPGYEPMTPEGREQTGGLFGGGGLGSSGSMAPPAREPRRDPFADSGGWGGQIAHELVKSYGFRRDERGDWSWSLANVAESFEEDPFWTTLDYLLLAVPVGKWGTAVRALEKGEGVVGAAYKAGRFAGRTPRSFAGQITEAFAGSERAAAAEAALKYRAGPGLVGRGLDKISGEQQWGTSLSRWTSNPITKQLDDEYMQWAKEFPGAVTDWERRGMADAMAKDLLIEDAYTKRMVGEVVRDLSRAGLDSEQGTRFYKLLAGGASPDQAEAVIRGWGLGARQAASAQRAWKNTFAFRNQLHVDSWEMNLISDETFWRNVPEGLGDEVVSYMPALKGEYQRLRAAGVSVPAAAAGARKTARKAGQVEGKASFHHRLPPDEVKALEALMDPTQGVERLGKAAHVVARQRYARRMIDSAVARPADEVLATVQRFMESGDPQLLRAAGISGARAEQLAKVISDMNATGKFTPEVVARQAGWMSVKDLFPQGIPGYLQRLDDDLLAAGGRGLDDVFIDPLVAKDIQGQMKFMDAMPDTLTKFWNGTLAFFKASKTAYNPATHFRNYFGAMTFHYLTVGGVPKFVPTKGLRSILTQNTWFKRGARTGIIGGTFDAEIRDALMKAGVSVPSEFEGTAIDFALKFFGGEKKFAKFLQKGAGKAEHWYRLTDEMWKLDAFIERAGVHEGIMRAQIGLPKGAPLADDVLEKVIAAAAHDVNKSMPTFLAHSGLGGVSSKLMPFSSFTFEALRVWKNAMIDNPHRVYFLNHVAEAMTAAAGGVVGVSPAEVQAAEDALPFHMRGKKAVALPWRSDEGKLHFVDLSYMIPLANMVEGEQGASLFFDDMFNVTAHPLASIATAVATNTDPFTGRPIAPNFTERQLGIPVTGEKTRRAVGLLEHTLTSLVPPVVPPGYVGGNLLELVRGQRHAATGELLEKDAARTIIANFAGFRSYEAGIENELMNVRKEMRDAGKRMTEAWDRWEYAAANGDTAAMMREERRIIGERNVSHGDGPDYFRKGLKRHRPGGLSNYSRRQLVEVLERQRAAGNPQSDRDKAILGELMARSQSGRRTPEF